MTIARLPALASYESTRLESAQAQLETLIGIYDRGMREPLPLACLTSAAYAGGVTSSLPSVNSLPRLRPVPGADSRR